ncbi:MAG: 3-oxoacyl-(acyl-carrier-protein) synthase 2 [Lentisphaerae bacterium ADurb.BinA184]|nr:MAG: 3-oxoacyl-(acyl-carrier-protein) synthase 2 [Lentisphaerae bacterium ADurb.BinA184]
MSAERRVVVSGIGVVSSVGVGVTEFWDGLTSGRSGVGPITVFDAAGMRCRIAGEVKNFNPEAYLNPKEAKRLDPFCHYAIAAADEALAMSGLKGASLDPTRAGCLVGGGIGGIRTLEAQARVLHERGPDRSSPLMVPMMIIDMASGYLSIRYGFRGPNLAVVTACASGSHAIGEAMWLIKRGDADVMVTGGTEACLCPLGIAGFSAMKALSERNHEPARASRPFDAGRDGFVPSEGAGILILESEEHARARGANALCEIAGYGASGDGYHITAPDPDGDGASRAITMAMKHAGLRPEDIGYINAHGTSTPLNDKTETVAIKRALGEHAYRVPVSSTKSMTGHALGAAGGMESVAAILTLMRGVIPPTINYEEKDPDCDLDYVPNTARAATVKTALNINLGFGGHNAVLAFRAL